MILIATKTWFLIIKCSFTVGKIGRVVNISAKLLFLPFKNRKWFNFLWVQYYVCVWGGGCFIRYVYHLSQGIFLMFFFSIFLFQATYYICFLFGYVTSFAYQFRTLKKSVFISSFAIILSIFFSFVFTLIIITFSRIGYDFNLPANRYYLHIFLLHLLSDIPFRCIFVFYFDAIISTRQYQQPLKKKQNLYVADRINNQIISHFLWFSDRLIKLRTASTKLDRHYESIFL